MLRARAGLIRPAPTETPDQWASRNREYPETAGVPGPRNPYLTNFMVPFGRKIHARAHKRVVAVTCAQTGKTDTLLDVIGSRLDQRPAPIIYVGPSFDFVSDQFESRLVALFEQSETLAAKIAPGSRMKKTVKWVAGVKIRLGSASSSSSLKSDSAAIGIADEVDELMANIRGQGDPIGLLEARGETYADFVLAAISTPSQGLVQTEVDEVNGLEMWARGDIEAIQSPIWRLWQDGTRHHFAWPCPDCGEYFVPMFKHLWWPKDSTPAQARREARLCCPACGVLIDEGPNGETKKAMVAAGVQVAPGQSIEDAKADRNEPDNETWSCWSSGLCSPFRTWGDRAADYLGALATGDPSKIQTILNSRFGECYSIVQDSEKSDESDIRARALPYAAGDVPAEAVRLIMGVDVQKFSVFYTIRAYGARGTSWLVRAGQLYGSTDQEDIWDDLSDLILTPIAGMMIQRVGIDSGFRPNKVDGANEHKVYEFCRRYDWLCIPCKGKDVAATPYRVTKIEVKPDGQKVKYSIGLAWLSSDFFKSLVYSKVRTPIGANGAFYVHENPSDDYCKQLVSEVRTVVDGKPKWVQRYKDNHYLDAEAICEAMAWSLNVQHLPGMGGHDDDDLEGDEARPVAVAVRQREGAPDHDRPAAPAARARSASSVRERMMQRAMRRNL